MQFQVPQFIEMEDRIFGPFTFKQFIYILGGAGLAFSALRLLPFPFNWPVAALALGLGSAFAFIKIHKKPLSFFVAAAFFYLTRRKLYIWKRRVKKLSKEEAEKLQKQGAVVNPNLAPVSSNKLKDLAWGLDINEHVAQVRLKEQLEKHKMQDPESGLKI